MDVRYLLLLFLLVSCLPSSEVGSGNLSNGSSSTSSNTNNNTIPEAITQWNFLGALAKNITINVSNLNNAYIVGKEAEVYLNTTTGAMDSEYCLISRFKLNDNLYHDVRSRIVALSYYNFTDKRTIKIFRVDFNDSTNSESICVGASASPFPIDRIDSNGVLALDPELPIAANTTFTPTSLCLNCSSVLTSSKMFITRRTLGRLEELKLNEIDTRALGLMIDPNNLTNGASASCSKSDCVARGYDCCLDNQCITDGSIRSSAYSQYPTQLTAAQKERETNPLAFLSYPHLYYICGSTVPSPPSDSSAGSYEQGLTQLKKDYFCVEHIKKYKTGATFHQDILGGTNFMNNIDLNSNGLFTDTGDIYKDRPGITDVTNQASTLYPIDIECRNDTDTSSSMHYKKVVERLYKNCGCSKTTLPEMLTFCPAYDYAVNYFEASGLPNRIDCYTPNPIEPNIPSQQTVAINARSAPHRYFRSCGDEFGSTATCATGDAQEGDIFEYQDEGKILPYQEDFGMNSILGQMNVTLDKAVPAKMIPVELDQVYQISTTSGFYSPCPTCGKDKWFSSFSAYPTSAYGSGLQAIGHSTERDGFGFNTTGGNYEDTIFGRACWIPPTMIPFTHLANSTVKTQRQNRLKSQAALFANGYQRDWFGFNKGALIGSFDGVSWFAVGKGRIVRTTSKKLFLAINAPFADLAAATLHVVNVQAYDGISQMAQMDYDPQYHLSHPYQNEAGNCQANHFCSTDTDCVTRLGWEYMCADVQDTKTQWPQFDVNANEMASSSTITTIDQILLQKRFPSASTKRCVYRGSGSLCIPNSQIVSVLNKRKTLTCAPNFYCANVATSGAFNGKVARYGANLEDIPVTKNHYYGKDANVLGRPLSYVSSSLTTSLPSEIKTNLTQNMLQNEATALSTTGICLPGKQLPDLSSQALLFNPYEQHKNPDAFKRTDYISQVGSCNSGLFTSYRYSSCPVFNSDGDYEFLSSTFTTTNYINRARAQNSCGLDSLLSSSVLTTSVDNLSSSSPFRGIESKPLNVTTVFETSIARDACLRRAGSVCHTDLDCGPNKMHADQVDNFSLAYFGNEAEKKYYSEYLVCGQLAPKPSPGPSSEYKTFNMNQNRCCREIGKDLTTYTSNLPNKVNTTSSTDYEAVSYNLKMTMAAGTAPNDSLRYSRLAVVDGLGSASRPTLTAYQNRDATSGVIDSSKPNVLNTTNQWKTLNEANSKNCCGGGWIRKFSDGGNDWSRNDRVYLDVTNFACINSRTVMLTKPTDVAIQYNNSPGDVQLLANSDYGEYCKDLANGVKGLCAQYPIEDTTNVMAPSIVDVIVAPTGDNTTHLKTFGIVFSSQKDYYFYPQSADGNKGIIVDNTNPNGRRNIQIKIPSYITRSWDNRISSLADGLVATRDDLQARVTMYEAANETVEGNCTKKTSLSLNSPTLSGAGQCTLADSAHCCYSFDSSTRILKVVPAFDGAFNPNQTSKKMGVKLINATPAGSGLITRMKPGTSAYYLKHLGKLELSGIPQITFEKLTCSDYFKRIVPGLFKHPTSTDLNVTEFINPTYSFRSSAVSTVYNTNYHALAHEPVFSANDFKCCTPLGKSTSSKSNCCSGNGTVNPSGLTYTCDLPIGVDLMSYFNRYVSNEGQGTTQPGGGLEEADFDPLTGEPLIGPSVTSKISALGKAYCTSGKVRPGGAFGEFNLEPYGNDTNDTEKIYGILDSSKDSGELTSTAGNIAVGYNEFMKGFRWNHHLYCDE